VSDIAVLGGDLCSVLGVFGVPMIVILHPLGNCRYNYRCIYYDYALSVVSLFVKNVTEKRQKIKNMTNKQTNKQKLQLHCM